MNKLTVEEKSFKTYPSIKNPFVQPPDSLTSNNNYDSWFSNPATNETNNSKENDWNIDYSLGAMKDDNPFSIKKGSEIEARNNEQKQKNIDFFMKNDENIQNHEKIIPNEKPKKEYLYENEVDDEDDQIMYNMNQENKSQNDPEYIICEEKGLPLIKQENLNIGSKETLNLVESDNESKTDNYVVKDSIFKVKKDNKNEKSSFSKENTEKKIEVKNKNQNDDGFEEVDLNQMTDTSHRKIKTEDSFYDSKFINNSIPMFNFNFGWTCLESKNQQDLIFSIDIKQENIIIQAVKDFPGPIKIEKNVNYITQINNKLFAYINNMLNLPINHGSITIYSRRFAWTILNEIFLNKKLSVFEFISSHKFKESLISYIETHFFPSYQHSINLEEFQNETNYLLNLINLSENQYEDLIEDDQWETIFFAKLFLSNKKTEEVGKDVKDIMIHYVERTYKKWYPMYVFTLLKLGRSEKFYEDSQFLSDNPMLYFWLLLKLSGQYDDKMWQSMLQTLFYHLNDKKKDTFLQFSFLIMSLGFDNENLPLLLKQNNNVHMIQMVETFFFLANTLSNFQYDSPKFLYKNLFPAFIIHAYNLLENGFHERAIEYVNLIESLKNCFFALEKNRWFMNSLREIKQRLIANVDLIYASKAKKTQVSMLLYNEKDQSFIHSKSANDLQQNLLEKPTNEKDFSSNFKKNIFNYFNSALDIIKNPLNEMAKGINSSENATKKLENQSNDKNNAKDKDFYYDYDLKTWIINGVPAQGEDVETEKQSKEKEKIEDKQFIPPPVMKSKNNLKKFDFFVLIRKRRNTKQ